MLYALREQTLGLPYNNEALDISIRPFQVQNREALEQDLATDWMKLEKPEDFRAMSALPSADKQALFAWTAGLAVKPQLFAQIFKHQWMLHLSCCYLRWRYSDCFCL